MRKSIVLAVLSLTACAPATISSNEAGGVVRVRGAFSQQAKGMQVATTECAKYGKIPRYVGTNDIHGTMSYDCVPR